MVGLTGGPLWAQLIERTPHTAPRPDSPLHRDHRRAWITVPEQFRDHPGCHRRLRLVLLPITILDLLLARLRQRPDCMLAGESALRRADGKP
jgi:type IV secretory pathway ATPase VirB11/archaellum biosynthesis ATPase